MNHAERRLHIAIADYLTVALPPDVVWTHFPAGEKRTPKTGALLKRMGLKKGIPDFLIWWHGKSYAIEVKAPGGEVKVAQLRMINRLRAAGVDVCIAYRFDAVESFLRAIGVPLRARAAA